MPDNLKDIDVFILCGGLGKRLRSVSKGRPKPMVLLGKEPFINILINYLVSLGFKRFILGLGYKADYFARYFKNREPEGIKIKFSNESSPLGTGGALKNAQRIIKSNPFFVLNGDSFSEFNPQKFLKFHKLKRSRVSMLLKCVKDTKDYGTVRIDKRSRLIGYNEKSGQGCLINTGVYIFDRRIFSRMPKAKKFSLERDFFPLLVKDGFFGYKSSGYFVDIGTPERFKKAKQYILRKVSDNL